MLNGIKSGCRSWLWSVGVLARSPLYVLAVAALFAAWSAAAYEWLWLPESSALVLLLALAWMLALAAIAVAVLALTTAGASAAAMGVEQRLRLRTSLRFGRSRFAWALATVAIAFLLAVAGTFLFGWLNDHALNLASFLTLHLRKPVGYLLVGHIFWTVEALFWIAVGGYLLRWLLAISNTGLKLRRHPSASAPGGPARIVSLVTGLLGACVFGGLAWVVATWHPLVKPGFWDYTQLAIRAGAALLVVSFGWLFWTLTLARLVLPPVTDRAASPTPS